MNLPRSLVAVVLLVFTVACGDDSFITVDEALIEPGDATSPASDARHPLTLDSVPGFAGVYLDSDDSFVISSRLASAEEIALRKAAEYRERTPYPQAQVKFRLVTYDLAQLRAWAEAVWPVLQEDPGVVMLDVDEVLRTRW